MYLFIYLFILQILQQILNSSSEHSQQNPYIGMRKSQEEKGPQESSFNVFHVVTCVRVDGWAFQSSGKKNE
jgi:hypothetical protein